MTNKDLKHLSGGGVHDGNIMTFGTQEQKERHARLRSLVSSSPVPDNELAHNMGLFLVPQTLSRILFMNMLYQLILDVQGVVLEFGCRWGQNLSLFTSLRNIYEPYNRLRKIVGFDSFEGFPAVTREDGGLVNAGEYATTAGYEEYLGEILGILDADGPLESMKMHEIIKGDVTQTLPEFLEENPATVISLAYFDLDIYQPTKTCLSLIKDRMTKGTVLGFDEVNDQTTPGETLALMEGLGLRNIRLKRWPYNVRASYLIVE